MRGWEREPRVHVLAAAQGLSIAGDRAHYLALVALATGALAHGWAPETALFALAAAAVLPGILVSFVAGPAVDRWPLARTLVATDAARGLVVLAMPALVLLAGPAALLPAVFALYTLNAFFYPARAALPPRLVRGRDLLGANSYLTLVAVGATVAAAAAGGWAVETLGWRRVLWLDSLTYFVSAALLGWAARRTGGAVARRGTRRDGGLRRYRRELAAGARGVLRSPAAGRAVAAWCALAFAAGVFHVAGALRVQSAPGRVLELGLLLAIAGLGAGAGTALASRRPAWAARLGLAGGLAAIAAGLAVFALAVDTRALFAAAFLTGVALGPWMALCETELQRGVVPRRRGRAFGARESLARLAFVAGAAAGAAVASLWGAEGALLAAALVLLLVAAGLRSAAAEPGTAAATLPAR